MPTNTDNSAAPLGSKENPVRCSFVAGEREYLERLRDHAGQRVQFVRLGSFAAGPYGNVLDGYSITPTIGEQTNIFFDMYHLGFTEMTPVPGYVLVA